MASLGIGSFMRGLQGGMEFRAGVEDRDRRRALEDEDRSLAREDRARRIQLQDEDRSFVREDRSLAKEDRQRRIAAENQSQAFTKEQRDRQRQDWQRDDAIKGAYSQAADQANATRNADVEGAIQPIEAQGPTPEGKGLPAFKVGDATFTDKGQARAAAEKDVKPFMDYYTAKSAPLVTEAYMRAGQPEKAQAYNNWLKTEGVQKGMESWAKALQAASRDDPDGFAKHITAAYNQQGYFEDGRTTTAKLRKDKDGNTVGMDLEFEDKATGKKWTRSLDGREDIYRMGVELMAPEQVFKFGLQQVEAADKARSEIAKDKRTEARETGKMLLEAALKEAAQQGPLGMVEFRKRLDSTMKSLLANDFTYARLSDDEKVAKAVQVLRAQDRGVAAAGYGGGAGSSPVPPTVGSAARSIPIWRPTTEEEAAPSAPQPSAQPASSTSVTEPPPAPADDEARLPAGASPASAPPAREPTVSLGNMYMGYGRKALGGVAQAGARGIRAVEDLRGRDLPADETMDRFAEDAIRSGNEMLEQERRNAEEVRKANSARIKLHTDMMERRDRLRREAQEKKNRERDEAIRGVREKQQEAERRYRESRGLPAYSN